MAASSKRRGPFLVLLGMLLVVAVACGEDESTVQAEAGAQVASGEVSPAGTSPRVDDDATALDDTVVTLPASTKPGSTDEEQVIPKSVESPSLRVSVDLPADAIDDPLGDPVPPDFVLADDRWVAGECCRISVVLQNQRPLFAEETHVETIDAAGLTWDLYDIGPRNGTLFAAVATDGEVSIAISSEQLFDGRVTDRSPLDVLTAIVRSVAVERQ